MVRRPRVRKGRGGGSMIGAIGLMRRYLDISQAAFQIRHVLEEGAAPNRTVVGLHYPLRALAEIWFTAAAALRAAVARCHNAAAYAVREHEFI